MPNPMQPTATQIARYQKLFQQRYGLTISERDAREQGAALMQVAHHIYRPLTKNEHEKYRPKK